MLARDGKVVGFVHTRIRIAIDLGGGGEEHGEVFETGNCPAFFTCNITLMRALQQN